MSPRPNAELARNPVNAGLRGDFGGAPVVFSASLTDLKPDTSYNAALQTLQPGFRTPYWIDEIRVTAESRINAAEYDSGAVSFTGLAGCIEAKFQTGHFAFSRYPMPVGLYAPRWSRLDSGVAVNGSGLASGDSVLRGYATVRWPLPKPLFMPAGDALQCLIQYQGYTPLSAYDGGSGFNIDRVNITYVGRLAAPGTPAPQVRHVPWVSWFQKNATTAYAQTNDEFRNPFSDKHWYVQRFTSRSYYEGNLILPATTLYRFDEIAVPEEAPVAFPSGVQARLIDSLGYSIVPNYTPVNDVFDGTRAAWTFGRTLGPREQFDLQLQSLTPAANTNRTGYTQVGVVGFREESI